MKQKHMIEFVKLTKKNGQKYFFKDTDYMIEEAKKNIKMPLPNEKCRHPFQLKIHNINFHTQILALILDHFKPNLQCALIDIIFIPFKVI